MEQYCNKSITSFKGNDPGAVQYGNFINYYQFNPASTRVKLLPRGDIWPGEVGNKFIGLDLGCNTGELTQQLYEFLSEIYPHIDRYLLGIDIDPILINRASEKNQFDNNVFYINLDIMDMTNKKPLLHDYLEKFHASNFTAIFCFSLTMWIHLNHGDDGLIRFLKEICTLTRLLIIEPQPWKCYKTAVRRMKRNNADLPLFYQLKIRENIENVIEGTILNEGFKKLQHTEEKTEWGRQILFFEKYKQ